MKYGIPNTGMVPSQQETGLRDEDLYDLISYLLALQGKPLPKSAIVTQVFRRDGEADMAIFVKCDARAIGDSDARAFCEDRSRKRYRDLLVGRPPDIPAARYTEVQISCRQRFGTDLDGLARCYRLEYALTRRDSDGGLSNP